MRPAADVPQRELDDRPEVVAGDVVAQVPMRLPPLPQKARCHVAPGFRVKPDRHAESAAPDKVNENQSWWLYRRWSASVVRAYAGDGPQIREIHQILAESSPRTRRWSRVAKVLGLALETSSPSHLRVEGSRRQRCPSGTPCRSRPRLTRVAHSHRGHRPGVPRYRRNRDRRRDASRNRTAIPRGPGMLAGAVAAFTSVTRKCHELLIPSGTQTPIQPGARTTLTLRCGLGPCRLTLVDSTWSGRTKSPLSMSKRK